MRPRVFAIPILAGWVIACLPAVGSLSPAQSPTSPKTDAKVLKSAHNFVDGFYGLYLSKIVDDDDLPSPPGAIETEGRLFSPRLRHELKEDFDAQDDAPDDEIVGLDFDPFLNAQDPCDEYEVGDATRRESSYWVAIYGICDGKKHERPDVYAEVAPVKSGWQFVNFHYPDGGDLLGILRSLRAQRRKSPKSAPGTSKSWLPRATRVPKAAVGDVG